MLHMLYMGQTSSIQVSPATLRGVLARDPPSSVSGERASQAFIRVPSSADARLTRSIASHESRRVDKFFF
jgi:hypothetical protein